MDQGTGLCKAVRPAMTYVKRGVSLTLTNRHVYEGDLQHTPASDRLH